MNVFVRLFLRFFTRFFAPTKPTVLTGSGSAADLAQLMVDAGSVRPLIITESFARSLGLLDDIVARVEARGFPVTIFDGVAPNPTFSIVEAGVRAGAQCDAVFVLGGGSAIDVGKVVAASLGTDRAPSRLVGVLKMGQPGLPLYIVPTTTGTGSEATNTAVISDDETHRKAFVVDPRLLPVATALDPSKTKTLPPHITAATAMDALTHAIEGYTSPIASDEVRRDAALAVRLIFEHLPRAYADGSDMEARERLGLASLLAGFAFTRSSLGYVHAISHQLSAHYNAPHGLANAIVLPKVMRMNRAASEREFAALEGILDRSANDQPAPSAADAFVTRVESLARTVDIPTTLDALEPSDYASITRAALAEANSSYATPRRINATECTNILRQITAA